MSISVPDTFSSPFSSPVLGYTTLGGGYDGGQDDDFYLAKNSPAIDAADPWSAPPVDIVGSPRRHDPGVTQTGPDYQETNLGSNSFNASGGTAQNFHTDNTYFNLSLPFAFPFYDATYRSVSVSTEGMLVLAGSVYPGDPSNSTAKLQHNTIIAPLWEDLSTYLTSTDDIFVDTTVANQVTIRWRAQSDVDHSAFNFSATLFSDGRIRFDYGSGNVSPAGQSPTVGISQGDGTFFVLSQYNGKASLASVNSVQFAPTSGLTFYDIGAYEFLGNSVDTTPPTVINTTPAVIAAQGGTPGPVTQIQVGFSKALNAVDADAPANYQLLLDANHDGIFGDSGDIAYNLTPTYTQTGTSSFIVSIDPGLGGQPLPVGHYQFTARSTIHDTSANALAGDGANAGTDYVRTFYVTGILVTPTSGLQTAEGGGTAQFSIVLTAQPTASVTIGLQSSNTSDGTVSPSSVTFAPANWNVPQAVTVTGVDDPPAGISPNYTIVTSAAVSADLSFNGMIPADVAVTVFDSSPPVANPDAYSISENATLTVPAATGVLANDSDNETLSAAKVTGPSHGMLTLNADGSFSYTPTTNFHGTDSFTYQASDGAITSNTATVTLTVVDTSVPVANPDAYSTPENATLTVPAATGVLANDTDADNDRLTAALVSGPSHGMLTLNADGSFSYTPATNFHGTDSFSYTASDGANTSNTATVTLTITNTSVPVANPDAYSTPENLTLTVPSATGVLANDTDASNLPLTAILVSGPSHGRLTFNADGSFSYTPTTNFHGTDSFSYKDSDGANTSNTATVTLTVVDTVVPVANPDIYNLLENGTLMVSAATGVLANDTDANNDSLTAILVSGPSHGTLTLNADGSFTYMAAAQFNGKDSFTYQASDGANTSNTATVTLNVYENRFIERLEEAIQQRQAAGTPDNSVPVANPDAYTAPQNTALTVPTATGVLANDTDAGNNTLMAQAASGPAHGTLAFSIDGSFSYTPAANFRGMDSFTYYASDGINTSKSVVVTLAIGPATLSWEGNSNGNWTDAQWSGSGSLTSPNNTVNAIVGTLNVVRVTSAQSALALWISNGGLVDVARGSALSVMTDTGVTGGGTLDVEPYATFSTGGTLTVDTGGSVVGGSVTAAAYQFNDGAVSANLAGAGGLTKSSAGTVILSGKNSYAGNTDVTSGTLIASSVTALPNGSGLTIGAGADLMFDSSASPALPSFSVAAASAIAAPAAVQGSSAVEAPAAGTISTISPAKTARDLGLTATTPFVAYVGQTSTASTIARARDTAIQAAVGWSPYQDLARWWSPWWLSSDAEQPNGQESAAEAADVALMQYLRSWGPNNR